MPEIEHRIIINAEMEKVFEVAKQIEKYPEFLRDVKSVEVLERNDKIITQWKVSINRLSFQWKEEILINKEKRVATFRQIEGDFHKYDGIWQLKEHNGGTEIVLKVNFEFKIPLFGAFLQGQMVSIMKENIENLLNAIKKKAEAEK